jgi:hypothetical protein
MWNKRAERAELERKSLGSREEIARRIVTAVDSVLDESRRNIQTELAFQHRVEDVFLPVWQVSDERFDEAKALFEASKDGGRQAFQPRPYQLACQPHADGRPF